MVKNRPDVKDILEKYSAKIEGSINTTDVNKVNYSKSYTTFKQEEASEFSRYEKWCHSLGSIVRINVAEKDKRKIQKFIDVAHLDIEPWQAMTLSVMSFLAILFLGFFSSVAYVLIYGGAGISGFIESFPILYFLIVLFIGVFLFYFINGYPQRLANKWRLKASSQMVPAILYIVVYMRHTPNFEKAISFASQHLPDPLALDFKKVFYNVQVGKFSTIKESLDNYLETWRGYSSEFIESFNLIESSLFEPDNARRISILEKALQVVLDGVYDRMLKFTHSVRTPLTNMYMLTVVLPILGIALLPMASAMVGDVLKWYHVLLGYNLLIPFMTFYFADKILFLRPGGYGESSLLERNPLYSTYKNKGPYVTAFFICLPFFILGALPFIFQIPAFTDFFGFQSDYTFTELGLSVFGDAKLFHFAQNDAGQTVGPFGIGALFLSLFIPLGIALFFSMSYKAKTKRLMVERENTKSLEDEFNNSLFQLGTRIGNGVPPELVFAKVAESSKGLKTEDFFRRVNYNIQQMGMSVEKAIFDPKRGAIIYYPSDLVATSMRVLVESAKKGLKIAAISLMSISEYVKNIKKITTRLRDMLAEVSSDMKSNMTFLAPLLSGVVVGLAAMIASILVKLDLPEFQGSELGGIGDLLGIFSYQIMIPPYFLQIAIGIYLIQIIFVLTGVLVTVDSGEDKLQKKNKIAKNLSKGIMLYFVLSLLATLVLFFLSSTVLG